MTPQIDRLMYIAALSMPSSEDRRAFLDFACRGDREVRELIEELLALEGTADELFEFEPTVEKAAPTGGDDESGIGARIGPYRLIDRLGAGGCGVVYLAEQLEPVKRRVALKVIRLGMNTEGVIARFNLEREALALMDHPNIARVLEAGSTSSGRPYFVMELVDGEKITDYCDRKKLGLRERLMIFVQVCEAIQHAHQKGVIHRDIKPSNVLVRDHDGRAVPKVIDFGIAKATAAGGEDEVTFTRADQIVGTPAYMSPEQAEGSGDIDTRSDIYSLGAMLCELLTGQPPFAHADFRDRNVDQIRSLLRDRETGMPSSKLKTLTSDEIAKVAGQRAVDPERLPVQLSGDLDWIIMKAIDKDRRRRYETANGLAMDVQRFLNEEPVLARPPSRRYLFSKLVRRNRIFFSAAGIALVGLLGGLGAATWLFLRERDARATADQARSMAEHARVVAEEARANESRLFRASQAVDVVAQAAVLAKYKDFEGADKLLSKLAADEVPDSLEAANTLIAVANWNLAQGRWKSGADRFHSLVHVLVAVDMTDTYLNSSEWLPAATAIVEWGDAAQYEDFRRLAMQRFGQSTNPIVAEQMLKMMLLKPAGPELLKELAPFAKVLEGSLFGPNREHNEFLIAWRLFSLALYAYRGGNYDSAANWAGQNNRVPGYVVRDSMNSTLLAMVDFRQKRIPKALERLDGARARLKEWENSPNPFGDEQRVTWSNWGALRILVREADGLAPQEGSKAQE